MDVVTSPRRRRFAGPEIGPFLRPTPSCEAGTAEGSWPAFGQLDRDAEDFRRRSRADQLDEPRCHREDQQGQGPLHGQRPPVPPPGCPIAPRSRRRKGFRFGVTPGMPRSARATMSGANNSPGSRVASSDRSARSGSAPCRRTRQNRPGSASQHPATAPDAGTSIARIPRPRWSIATARMSDHHDAEEAPRRLGLVPRSNPTGGQNAARNRAGNIRIGAVDEPGGDVRRFCTGQSPRGPPEYGSCNSDVAGHPQDLEGPGHDVRGGDAPGGPRTRQRDGGATAASSEMESCGFRTQRRRNREHGLSSEGRARTVEDSQVAMTTVRIVPASGAGTLHLSAEMAVSPSRPSGISKIARESPTRPSRTIPLRRETWLQAVSSLGPMTTQDVDRSLRLRKGRTMTAPHARIRDRMPGNRLVIGPFRLQRPAAPLHHDALSESIPSLQERQVIDNFARIGQSRGDPVLHRHRRRDGKYPGHRLGRPVLR